MQIQKNQKTTTARDKVSGFTLLEMLVATAIFTTVMVVAVGAFISLIEANRKARAQQTVLSNLQATVESMSRTIRGGRNYECHTSTGGLSVGSVIPCSGGATQFSFTKVEDPTADRVVYIIANNRIWRSEASGISGSFVPMTSEDIRVDRLEFREVSFGGGDQHPKIQIAIRGLVNEGEKTASELALQTTVSQNLSVARTPATAGGGGGGGGGSLIPYCAIPQNLAGFDLEIIALEENKTSFSTVSSRGGNSSLSYTLDPADHIQPGQYDVLLAAWDEQCESQTDGVFADCSIGVRGQRWAQDFERLTVELHFSNGSSRYTAGLTDDIPCGENFLQMKANGTLNISSSIDPWVWPAWDQHKNNPNIFPWGTGQPSSPFDCKNYFGETHDFSIHKRFSGDYINTGSLRIVGFTIHHGGCDGNTNRHANHPFRSAWGSTACPNPHGVAVTNFGEGNPPWRGGHSVVPACIAFVKSSPTVPGGGGGGVFEGEEF